MRSFFTGNVFSAMFGLSVLEGSTQGVLLGWGPGDWWGLGHARSGGPWRSEEHGVVSGYTKGHIINYGRGGTNEPGKFYPRNFAIPPIE